jgi:hypothetical protein
MSTSPVDPEDIRAAAEVHQELGPEYSDAVVAAFLDKVDRAVAARVEARLAEARLAEARLAQDWQHQPAVRDGRRRTLLRGVALGVCASALVAGVGISHVHADIQHAGSVKVVPGMVKPGHRVFKVGPDGQPPPPVLPPPPAGG